MSVRMDDSSMRGLRRSSAGGRDAARKLGPNGRFLDEGIETRGERCGLAHRAWVRMDDSSMRGLRRRRQRTQRGQTMVRMDDSSMRGLRLSGCKLPNAGRFGPNGRFLDEGIETCRVRGRARAGLAGSEWTIPR